MALIDKSRHVPIEVVKLNKRYKGGDWANRDISLIVNRGEVVGILGPNGAGKTTLVRQITAELLPTSGSVCVFGRDVVRHPNEAKSVMGVVPQEANLFDGLSVYHHLRVFGQLRGLSRRSAIERANELISQVGLEAHRHKSSGILSTGLRRRLVVAIAALARPPLLILDEPTTGLDPESRLRLWDVLRGYVKRGAAVLLTTHYMEEAEKLCDRVGIIKDGSLVALDTLQRLRAAHDSEYRLTYETDDGSHTMYGNSDQALIEEVRAQGVDQYAVARTNLEDVYLALTSSTWDGDGAYD